MKRPVAVEGKTYKIVTGCGAMYVTINRVDGKPYEIFAKLGKAGGCSSSQTEALGRLVSLLIKNKVSVSKIIEHLGGISCQSNAWADNGENVLSCADAIAKALKLDLQIEEAETSKSQVKNSNETCPDCQSSLIFQEGCLQCPNCSFSKC